jgi:hydrocephalus-inducing protein
LIFIAENPEVIRFAMSCAGVKPQLEVDKHLIQFDRLLLQRDLLQNFTIKNVSPLALAWKINNPDALGEGFSIS